MRISSLKLVLLLVGVASTAAAAPPRARRASKTATLLLDPGGVAYVKTVGDSLERSFSTRRELSFTPLDALLQPLDQQLEQLQRAATTAAEGREAIANLEVQKGVEALETAKEQQEQAFHVFSSTAGGIEDHAGLLADLAIAHFLAGDEQKARDALQQVFVLSPKHEYDPKKYPPQMKRLFTEVRLLVDELGVGEARITTRPAGAEVRVNGSFVGFSPARAQGLVPGRNLVTLVKTGFATKTVPLYVEGGEMVAKLVKRLEPLAGEPSRLIVSAMREAAEGRPVDALPRLARALRRRVLFAAATRSRDDVVTVTVVAYDAQQNRIVGKASATTSALDPDRECQGVVQSLVATLDEPPPAPRRTEESWLSRFRRSPYFWPVIGGVAGAAVVGTSVGLGVYYGTRGNDNARRMILLPAVAGSY